MAVLALLLAGLHPFPTVHPASALASGPPHLYPRQGEVPQQDYRRISGPDPSRAWRFAYAGVFSGAPLPGGGQFLAIHGENTNSRLPDGALIQNTVRPQVRAQDCADGPDATGLYQVCWAAYSGFVSGLSRGDDTGPLVWPEAGYRQGSGVRHPHVTVADKWLYLYYSDGSSGQGDSIRVSRAPAAGGGRAGTWRTLGADGKWHLSLPSDFDQSQISDFYASKRPRGKAILGDHLSPSFAVAQVQGTDPQLFAGIEQWQDDQHRFHVGIRYSRNLIDWSRPRQIIDPAPWREFSLSYPIPVNKDRTSAQVVDYNFTVRGTNGSTAQAFEVEVRGKTTGELHRLNLDLPPGAATEIPPYPLDDGSTLFTTTWTVRYWPH